MSTAVASLTDVTATNPPASTTPVEAIQPSPAPSVNPDAAEVGRIILESGFSKDQVNDLLQAPGALQQLRYLIANDPKQFVQTLERADPAMGAGFLDAMTSLYLERYGSKADEDSSGGSKAAPLDAETQSTLRDLQERLERTERERVMERQAAQLASTHSRYKSRVDDLFSQLPKDLKLTGSQEKALRAQLQEELNNDPNARQRTLAGNFVDVPLKFQSIIQDWTNDQKAAQDALKAERERATTAASAGFLSGPVAALMPKADSADSWENTERDLAAAFKQAGMGA